MVTQWTGVPRSVISWITPVNTFRIVFNEYFGADFELLEDRSFTYPDLDHVYDFYEITDRLK